MDHDLLEEIKRLKSIADLGLLYCDNEYDKARYLELLEIGFRLLSKVSGQDMEILRENFLLVKDYPTVKTIIQIKRRYVDYIVCSNGRLFNS